MSESRLPQVDGRDQYAAAELDKLRRFLPKSEHLIWTGSPQLSRLFLRNLFRTGLMLLIGSVGLYFLYMGTTHTDLCGTEMSKLCRRFYFWPWLGFVAAALYIPFLWLSFLMHASGLLREFYGLTDSQALRLRSNPFDRFQSAKLSGLPKHRLGVRKWFGSMTFGPITFLSLCDDDIARLVSVSAGWQCIGTHQTDVPDSQGSVP